MTVSHANFAIDPQSAVGHVFPPQRACVEAGRLRYFLNTIGEAGAIYHDVDAARAAGYRDIPIPPTYLFCLQSLDSGSASLRVLDLLGVDISRILHGEQKFVFHRPVCVGDELSFTTTIGEIADKKGGALTMVNQNSRVENDQADHVADMVSVLVVRNPKPEPAQ